MEDPLVIYERLWARLSQCGECDPDGEGELQRLEAALGATGDPIEDARRALERAEQSLRTYHGPHPEAIRHELVQAAVSVGRALALRG